MTDTPNALEPVLKFLYQYDPFRLMLPVHQEYLGMHLEQVFFAENEIILGPEDDEQNCLFIIKNGLVSDEQNHPENQLTTGDCFPVNALSHNNSISVPLMAQKSTICYRLKQPHFDYLMQQSTVFKDYCIDKKRLL